MVSVRVYIKITPVMIHLSLTITGLGQNVVHGV